MKTMIAFLIFLLVPFVVCAQMLVETPAGEWRIRYELCDGQGQNCRMVEQTIRYQICDEHHNCEIVDAFQAGKARIWDEEELAKSGTFVFSLPVWQ